MTHRIPIKLHLTGKSRLIFKFYVFQDFHVLGTQETGLPKLLLLFNTDCIVVTVLLYLPSLKLS